MFKKSNSYFFFTMKCILVRKSTFSKPRSYKTESLQRKSAATSFQCKAAVSKTTRPSLTVTSFTDSFLTLHCPHSSCFLCACFSAKKPEKKKNTWIVLTLQDVFLCRVKTLKQATVTNIADKQKTTTTTTIVSCECHHKNQTAATFSPGLDT